MSKPTPNKKPAAAGAAKNVPPSASKPKGTGDQEVDEIMSAMSGMQLSNQTDWGFDFKGQAPYFWWNYNYLSETYCKMEILMNQVAHEDVRASVSQSGKYLLIHVNLPKFFLNVVRLFGYYFDATAGKATFTQEAAMFAQGQSAVNKIKQMMELTGGAKTVIAVKLPFKVQANFWILTTLNLILLATPYAPTSMSAPPLLRLLLPAVLQPTMMMKIICYTLWF